MPAHPDEERCTWSKTTGRRCRQRRASPGSLYCEIHETRLAEHARRLTLAEDTPDVPVDVHLQQELRASLVMVKVLELQVHDLLGEDEPWVFTETERESRDGGPGGGYESVRRKKLLATHPVLAQYLLERRHHMDVVKTCVAAGLAARQIAAVERVVESLMQTQMMLAEELGFDPTAPDVRAKIMRVLQRAHEIVGQDAERKALEG